MTPTTVSKKVSTDTLKQAPAGAVAEFSSA